MAPARGPIFVAGVDRSGIGLMGEVLDAHPRIAISRRTNFWSFYYRRFGDLAHPANRERCIADMLRYTRIQALQPDRDALLDAVRRTPTYAALFAALQHQHLDRVGKARWGDKSHACERYADAILREFPDAVVVHVIRDPRDRYASQATHRRAARGAVGSGAALGRWSLRLARRNRARYASRYLVVRYEDLAVNPVETLRHVCAFVGEDLASQMLQPPDAAGVPRRFTDAAIGRYRRDLTAREIALIDLVARREMRHAGYAPARVRLSWRERLAFVVLDVPRNLVRMMAWWVRQARSERIRRPAGRRLAAA